VSRPVLACMRCGNEGPDVVMRLADLEDEAKEDGERLSTVTVAMPVGESRHGVRGIEYSEVPAGTAASRAAATDPPAGCAPPRRPHRCRPPSSKRRHRRGCDRAGWGG
jgi:hypothetical protein